MQLLQKIKEFRDRKIEYFYAISLITIYSIWKIIKTYISPNVETLSNFGTYFNEGFADLYVKSVAFVLYLLSVDYTIFLTQTGYGEFIAIAIKGAAGIYVSYHCLGVTSFLVYIFTLFLLPGSMKRKIYFAIAGSSTIFFVNVLRMIILVFSDKYSSQFWLDLNHSVNTVIIYYCVLFIFHFVYLKPFLFKDK